MIETTHNQSQTWTTDVLIPLVQNLIGGVAMSCIAAASTMLFITADSATIQSVALMAGVVISCGFTVVRFFSDDLGIMGAAYRAGRQSQQAEIKRLQNMLYDAEQQIDEFTARPKIVVGGTRNHQQILDAVADAEKIIRWAFDGQPISRAACAKRGIKQRPWERAHQAMQNAGIIVDGQWVYEEKSTTLAALQRHYARRAKQSTKENVFTPY